MPSIICNKVHDRSWLLKSGPAMWY